MKMKIFKIILSIILAIVLFATIWGIGSLVIFIADHTTVNGVVILFAVITFIGTVKRIHSELFN